MGLGIRSELLMLAVMQWSLMLSALYYPERCCCWKGPLAEHVHAMRWTKKLADKANAHARVPLYDGSDEEREVLVRQAVIGLTCRSC
mmetsp:Transcript_710/g.2483  ORF Transcript_710/g.2483 Transcript_710/m.2483 type:complete len:87 (-) Transcript_710:1570-1830(-)